VRARRRDHHPRRPSESTGGPPAGGSDRPRDGGPRSGRSRRKRGSGSGASDTSERTSAGGDAQQGTGDPGSGAASGGGQGTGKAGGNGQAGGARNPARGGRRKDRNRRPKVDALGFWGDAAALPSSEGDVRITDDPGAVSRSLGTPPLPGQEIVAPHYFAAVYERAVMTAGALAAAGGLIDTETLAEELGE
jgi:hypothetical protein